MSEDHWIYADQVITIRSVYQYRASSCRTPYRDAIISRFYMVIRKKLKLFASLENTSTKTTMASQDENQLANLIGSLAYNYIVWSISVGLCYGMALFQYGAAQ